MDTLTELASFLHKRLDEQGRDAELFHELTCNRQRGCGCPCRAQLLHDLFILRDIVTHCEERIANERRNGIAWPLQSTLAFQTLKALAAPFELHPDWQDNWYP
ncbi:DUF6221 family protein [Streptomyces lasiicapitis]|uniref:Uncharacterized protein n=1 Tax=Streptomyces lasiicapitis TaxID=1923961 RepID=A0ABQ2MWH7_9ACTN|nr:DUF6221 family protein [Streptomyces lasiicapitis]GGO59339.1 hypothetical protein GCM10012286_80720 [Streptomyces lasiicapitis]